MALPCQCRVPRMGDAIDTMEGSPRSASDESEVQVEDGDRHRVDWIARVTPLLEGDFNLYDFGLAKEDNIYGQLTQIHLRTVATAVGHFGAGRLTYEMVRELEEFLGRHPNTLRDEKALDEIRTVISQIPDPLESLVFLFSDQT